MNKNRIALTGGSPPTSGLGVKQEGHPLVCNNCNIIKPLVKTPLKAQGKIIGYLEGDTLIKICYGSKHKLRYPPAWAIDAEVFDREVKPNATEIVVIDKETGVKYHASVETFDKLSRELDRGWGRQYFLTLNHWKVEDNGDRQLMFDWGGVDNG